MYGNAVPASSVQSACSSPSAQPASRRSRRLLGLPLGVTFQFAISAGDGIATVALANRVFQTSHASWAVAAVFLAITVPISALSPMAGLLLDRMPVKPILAMAGLAEAVIAVALIWATSLTSTLVLAAGFGLCAALLQPGMTSIVARLVARDRITRANSYLQAASWTGLTAGPLLAGLLIAVSGTGLALAANAAVYAAGAAAVAVLRLAPRERTGPAARGRTSPARRGRTKPAALGRTSPAPRRRARLARRQRTAPAPRERGPEPGQRQSLGRQLRAGLDFLRTDADSGLLVLVIGVMDTFGNMAVVAEVVLAEQVLRSGASGYAMLTAGWTAGMVVGTIAGGRLRSRWLLGTALAGAIVTGVGVALAGLATVLWEAIAAYALGGLANGFESVATLSFLGGRAPGQIAGRVFAIYSGVTFGAISVGMAIAAGLLTAVGARGELFIAGGGATAAGLVGSITYLARRRSARRLLAGSGRTTGTTGTAGTASTAGSGPAPGLEPAGSGIR